MQVTTSRTHTIWLAALMQGTANQAAVSMQVAAQPTSPTAIGVILTSTPTPPILTQRIMSTVQLIPGLVHRGAVSIAVRVPLRCLTVSTAIVTTLPTLIIRIRPTPTIISIVCRLQGIVHLDVVTQMGIVPIHLLVAIIAMETSYQTIITIILQITHSSPATILISLMENNANLKKVSSNFINGF